MKLFVTFTFMAGYFSLGCALYCYICNSYTDSDCLLVGKSLHVSRFLQQCGEKKDGKNYTHCKSIYMQLDLEYGNHTAERRIHRDCGFIDDEDKVDNCYYKSSYNTKSWVCSCYHDNCNGAVTPSTLSTSRFILLALGVTLSLRSHF